VTVRRFSPTPTVEMRLDRHGRPSGFHWRRRWRTVASVEKTWDVQTEWWRGDDERVDRHYHEVVAHDGLRCVIFHDRVADVWHLQSVDD
jgi:hypothetical protein